MELAKRLRRAEKVWYTMYTGFIDIDFATAIANALVYVLFEISAAVIFRIDIDTVKTIFLILGCNDG